jgi:hypothetical protein
MRSRDPSTSGASGRATPSAACRRRRPAPRRSRPRQDRLGDTLTLGSFMRRAARKRVSMHRPWAERELVFDSGHWDIPTSVSGEEGVTLFTTFRDPALRNDVWARSAARTARDRAAHQPSVRSRAGGFPRISVGLPTSRTRLPPTKCTSRRLVSAPPANRRWETADHTSVRRVRRHSRMGHDERRPSSLWSRFPSAPRPPFTVVRDWPASLK